jgi:hypothetical protein
MPMLARSLQVVSSFYNQLAFDKDHKTAGEPGTSPPLLSATAEHVNTKRLCTPRDSAACRQQNGQRSQAYVQISLPIKRGSLNKEWLTDAVQLYDVP